jgi:hypothetical protein
VAGVLFFLKRWEFFKYNFSFGLALQALLKTLVVCWLVGFLIVLANCDGYLPYSALISAAMFDGVSFSLPKYGNLYSFGFLKIKGVFIIL